MASDKKALEQINAFIDTKYIPLDGKIKLAILIALIILPIGLYYYFAYTDNVKKIEGLENNKSQLETEITKAKKAAKDKKKIEASLAKTQELFRKTATVLPKEKEIPGLLTNISDLGQRAPLELKTFKPGGESLLEIESLLPTEYQDAVQPMHERLQIVLDEIGSDSNNAIDDLDILAGDLLELEVVLFE